MKANNLAVRKAGRDDAVSPVIAVILMVAITVVLAATVYVWVSGFSDQGEQAPAASFKVTNCDTTDASESFTIKLISSDKSLDTDDLNVTVTQTSDGSSTTNTFSLPAGETWSVGTSKTLGDNDGGSNDDLSSSTEYTLDIVHTPSGNIISSPTYQC